MRFHGNRAAPGEACVLLKRAQAGGADGARESTRDVRVILLQGSVEVDGWWAGNHFQDTASSIRSELSRGYSRQLRENRSGHGERLLAGCGRADEFGRVADLAGPRAAKGAGVAKDLYYIRRIATRPVERQSCTFRDGGWQWAVEGERRAERDRSIKRSHARAACASQDVRSRQDRAGACLALGADRVAVAVAGTFRELLIGQVRTGGSGEGDGAGVEVRQMGYRGRRPLARDVNHLAASGSDHTDVRVGCRGQLKARDLGDRSGGSGRCKGAIRRLAYRGLRDRKTARVDGATVIQELQLLGGITGLDTGGGAGGSDGERRDRAQNAGHGNLQRHGAPGRNVARQGEIDLIFRRPPGSAGIGYRDGHAAHDSGDGFAGAEVVVDVNRIIPRRIGSDPGSPGDQDLSRFGRRTRV